MADLPPPDRSIPAQSTPRWPWIMGGLLGGFFLLAAGLGWAGTSSIGRS